MSTSPTNQDALRYGAKSRRAGSRNPASPCGRSARKTARVSTGSSKASDQRSARSIGGPLLAADSGNTAHVKAVRPKGP